MDRKLVAWARAVKRRGGAGALPPLWLFTDPARMADPVAAVRALPKFLCGVVFRHDAAPGRAALAREVARVCRQRGLMLAVAGTPVRLPGVRRHLREGWGHAPGGTSSAHGMAGVMRARRAKCAAVFLSAVFPTVSHPGGTAMGPVRWAQAAGRARRPLALGGIAGSNVGRLPKWVVGVGAIGALVSP